MTKHPMIVINPDWNCTSKLGDVVFPTRWCGIETEGTAYRMDTVPIMLRKVVDPPPGVPSDEDILHAILAEVRRIKAEREGKPVKQAKKNKAVVEMQPAELKTVLVKEHNKRNRKTRV